jgi:hypothetical protein
VISELFGTATVNVEVPSTCCIVAGEDGVCTRFRGTGCKTALANIVLQNSAVLGVLGVSVMFIEVSRTVLPACPIVSRLNMANVKYYFYQ